ncbi:protein kinase superfamily protein [Striga asiatica]|uniref:non-specific serine/threonine protein kinase n=1 Tax=Striga asiatica TaxID=4170 RepID=A0A5A7Q116_STRAF|nr:protein kinase superfamily protein [Striga asiatica]
MGGSGAVSFLKVLAKNFDVLAGYASIRAIETKSPVDDQQWLTYWVLYSMITLFELTFAKLIEWLPFWSYIKLIFTCWLVIPYFSGAAYVYEQYVRPYLVTRQKTVNIWYVPRKKDIFGKPDDILTAAEKYIQENGPEAFEKMINKSRETTTQTSKYSFYDDNYRYEEDYSMGNCLLKDNQVVLEINEVRNNSQEYIRREEDQVEWHNNGSIVCSINNEANHAGFQDHQHAFGFDENIEMDEIHNKRPLHRAPHLAFMEKDNQRSHPLPTPDLAPHPQWPHKHHTNSILPLPRQELTHNHKYEESSSISPQTVLSDAAESEILSSPYLKPFALSVLINATSNFSEDCLLGEGGFGCVYKGWLDFETLNAARPGSGLPVAIKRLILYGFQGHKEWLSEVNYLGRLHHPNLVKLIGYCIEGDDRILVYEYMSGGSLEKHLFKRHSPSLSWARRIKVALDAARGLCFLHESESPVIYRDFKTSNILLDSEFNAKLSDFGLAKAGPTESQTHVSTRVMGTQGYCDPWYLSTGKLTLKCDVYSFGVVLLELLTGRRAIDETKCHEEKNLVSWVKLHLHDNGKIFRIMDTKLEGQYCKRSAYVAANIALRCVSHEPKYRPPMTYILEILENLPSHKNHHHQN